jgi:hypothetical protein
MARKPPLLAEGVAARRPSRGEFGPSFIAPIVCEACDHRWLARYRQPPEVFPCPACGKREGIRDLPEPILT